ncbi:hypothetical protein PR048_020686 [Dryococelus australis]|uniref:Uncharacterized protein n=1 Tax=Dryococelus australis TaxID=614101 RepID=A0ABQ9H717_9NEOP|nr:hypothetical protein PR048_020686 [Dryococelus australis]
MARQRCCYRKSVDYCYYAGHSWQDVRITACIWRDKGVATGSQWIIVTMLAIAGRTLLASHQGEPDSIPGRVTPGFSQVEIVPDDVVGQRVFSVISRLPRLGIPALLRSHLISPSSALRTRCYELSKSLNLMRCRTSALPSSGNSLNSHSGGPGFDSLSGHPDFGFPWFSEIAPGECWDGFLTKAMADSFPNPSSLCNLHLQDHDGNTARHTRKGDEELGVRVSVARIALSHLDIDCATI